MSNKEEIEKISSMIVSKLKINREFLSDQFFKNNDQISTRFFVLDDLLPSQLCLDTYHSFPELEHFSYLSTFREKKYTFRKFHEFTNKLYETITDCLQDKRFLLEISKICKINDLEPDVTLYAGGLSRMEKSNFLNPHIDNSHNANRTMYRRLNALYYVTPNMTLDDGGNFELWDNKVQEPLKIESRFNRLIVMETTRNSWHSVDEIKVNKSRCCVSNYYFTKSSPIKEDYYHVTSFTGRPHQKALRYFGVIDNFVRRVSAVLLRINRNTQVIRKVKD